MADLSLVCAASLPLTLLAAYALQPLADARRRLPPGPRPLPLLGNLLDIGEHPHRSFASLADIHGPLMFVRLGTVPAVVATSPEAAREVLQKKNASMAARRGLDAWRVMDHDANSMVALPPRGKWRAFRQHSRAALLGPRPLDEHRAVREEEARELVRRLSAAGGAPVDVAREAFVAMVNVLCRGMFSEKLDPAVVSELTDVAEEAAVLSGLPNVSDFFPALAALDLQGIRRKAGKVLAWLYTLIDEQIERRKLSRADGDARRNDLLDVLLDMDGDVRDEDGWVMNQESIRGLLMELLLGATSVPTTIEWAMSELLQNPPAIHKLQAELRNVLGTRPCAWMEESDTGSLPYLQAVVKETLRLHPPVPFATGLAEEAVEIEGYNVPKGTTALVNIWGICRNAKVWDEPNRFLPERFLHREIEFFGADFELIAFSAGKRICPGLQLSSKMVPLILGSMLYHFDWTLPGEEDAAPVDMTEQFGLVLSMAVPLRVVPKKIL
ncbi:geraniol 8-hydroxylase [Triticum aestivum]|nr:geraniol 8-hydroxylase-like [Triticum aestivum]